MTLADRQSLRRQFSGGQKALLWTAELLALLDEMDRLEREVMALRAMLIGEGWTSDRIDACVAGRASCEHGNPNCVCAATENQLLPFKVGDRVRQDNALVNSERLEAKLAIVEQACRTHAVMDPLVLLAAMSEVDRP